MGKYSTLSALLSAIADAIRSKTGGKAPLAAEDFPEAIGGIVTFILSREEHYPATPRPRRATSWRA